MEDRYLFRGKLIDNSGWVYGLPSYDEDGEIGEIEVCSEDYIDFHLVNPSTICQCTGLKDKYGNLIFENDILSGHIDDEFPEDETRKRVVWHENGWWTNEPGCDDYEELDDFDSENFEVIGNMIDNPELLEA